MYQYISKKSNYLAKVLSVRKLTSNTLKSQTNLALVFNQQPSTNINQLKSSFNQFSKLNPFSTKNNSETGLFGKKELNSFEGFYKLKEQAEYRVNSLIKETLEPETNKKRKLVEIFDDISNELCCVADLAEFVRTSHPDVNYRQAADLTFAQISQIVEKLNTNLELYIKLKESINPQSESYHKLDECDKRVCKLFLADFEQSGIHLDTSNRNKFVNINDQLVNVLMKFQINSQTPSQIYSNEVDNKFSKIITKFRDPIQVDTMFINSDDELVREFVYRSYLKENKVQESYFRSILSKRQQLANLCGFETYSHRANLNMIMDTPDKVMNFLKECAKSISNKAEQDFNKMKSYKKHMIKSDQPLMQWDVPIISARMKNDFFSLDGAFYSSYFSLGCCMEGLNLILNNLYKVNLEVENLEPGELWHKDIYKLAVKDSTKNLLGYIYCDFYSRSDKFSNVDCHFTIQCSKQLSENHYQLPIVVLHLNLPTPTKDRPTLLSFEMMQNLFHEFGHAMHSMFAKTRYQHVSGTRCSTDFAEVPSQLMEFYCRDPRVLKLFAKHYLTNETLDDKSIHKLCESKKLFASCELQTQVLNSMLDQAFHLIDFDKSDLRPVDVIEKYTNEYHMIPYVKDTHWHLRYTHLVGYGAKYYSYLVSKAIASKIWSECFEADPLSSSAGQNYRQKLLQFGGEKRPEELINSLIGLDFQKSSLVENLTKNLLN